nr:phosphotransferase [Priestia megaterium]
MKAQKYFEDEVNISIKLSNRKITPKLLYHELDEKILITEYIQNDSNITLHKKLELVIGKLKKFHQAEVVQEKCFYDIKKEFWLNQYDKLPKDIKKDFDMAADALKNQKKFYDDRDEVWSHNDCHQNNILVNSEVAFLIDFDQVGPNSKYFDLATLSLSLELDEEHDRFLLQTYSREYNYKKFLQQKTICAAQYALAVISLIDNFESITFEKTNSTRPFFWEGNEKEDINFSRFKLAHNFLNYFNQVQGRLREPFTI